VFIAEDFKLNHLFCLASFLMGRILRSTLDPSLGVLDNNKIKFLI